MRYLPIALVLVSAVSEASLIRGPADETSGTGLGAVNTVLTVQTTGGATTESGCVAYDGTGDVVGPSACPAGIAGGDEQASSQTRSLSEVGLSSAYNFRLVFNYNETQSGPLVDNIVIDDLQATIYNTDGSVCFTSGAFSPDAYREPFSGTGNAGFVYRLDAEQAAQAEPCFADPANRIGLAASLSGADSGNETFYIADANDLFAASADLALSKSDSADPVAASTSFTYTLTVDNAGPNVARDVVVVDTLPASVSFVSATPSQGSCTQSGRTVTCDLGDLGDALSATVDIVVTSGASNQTITNDATVGSATPDPDASNNAASENTTVGTGGASTVNLAIVKSDAPDPVVVGQPVTYTLTVTNPGATGATGVTVTDQVPASFAVGATTTSQGTCTTSGQTVTCELGAMASGGSATITIEATPSQAGSYTNTSSVSAEEADSNPGNNSDSEQTQVVEAAGSAADLALSKSDAVDPVAQGATISYTLTVTNNGPDTADNVVVTDQLPASTTFVSATPSQGSCSNSGNTVTCSLGSLANGGSATVDIDATAPAADTTVTNSATVGSDTSDPNGANNSATEQTTVGTPGASSADVSVTKIDSADPIEVGDTLTYTIFVSNAGPDTADGVTVTDQLPAGFTYGSATPSTGACSNAGQTVTCSLGSMASGADETITITGTVGDVTQLVNTVSVAADNPDPNTANNSASETTNVVGGSAGAAGSGADLSLTKSVDDALVSVGESVTFTLQVNNAAGSATATSTQISDTVPAELDPVSATPSQGSCSIAGQVVTCDLGSVAGGAGATVTIVADAVAQGNYTNTASASSAVSDPDATNNSDSASGSVAAAAAGGTAAVPTLGEWALLLLVLMMGGIGLRALRV